MDLNADFSRRVLVHSDAVEWLPSPMPGVHRRMLDRIGDEVARATTIVRYAPGSQFSPHVHTGGEEFLVLQGVFSDEHGDFPAGSYIRNPPTSKHTPGSAPGCVIFVKLWQFDQADRQSVRMETDSAIPQPADDRPGVAVTSLYDDARETVRIEAWAPNARVHLDLPDGGEFLVLAGGFHDGVDALRQHSWLRLPRGAQLDAVASDEGARVWVKTGHLRFVQPPG